MGPNKINKANLTEIFKKYPTDKPKYADFYSRYFKGLQPKVILEIGVLKGGSHYAWQDVFHGARVVGIDIDPTCKDNYKDLEVYIGDQTDTKFLDYVLNEIGSVPDIIIDDGGHKRSHQVKTMKHLYPKLLPGSLYIIEDLETSFLSAWNDYHISAIDYVKSMVEPIDYKGKQRALGESTIFHYAASSIVFEPNIVLLRK